LEQLAGVAGAHDPAVRMDGGGEQERLAERGKALGTGSELHAAERVDAHPLELAGEEAGLALRLEDLHLGGQRRPRREKQRHDSQDDSAWTESHRPPFPSACSVTMPSTPTGSRRRTSRSTFTSPSTGTSISCFTCCAMVVRRGAALPEAAALHSERTEPGRRGITSPATDRPGPA